MKAINYTINELGLSEISEFLSTHHINGKNYFTRDQLAEWGREAARCLNDGDSIGFIELKSWESISGHTETFIVSEDGFDFEELSELTEF